MAEFFTMNPLSPPLITEAEWKVMRVLWSRSPLTALEIIEALRESESWQVSTVKTLLGRLYRKKVLGIQRQKNLYLYRPLVSEDACLQNESKTFLDRFFGGSATTLMAHFARREKLTPEDLAELRRILDEGDK
jgi:BlaI family penicillinase repressor